MAWIESHQSLLTHGKTIRAAAALKVNRYEMIGHLHALWWWGLDNADTDGSLRAATPEVIAEGAGWPLRGAQRFVDVLTETGFLEADGGSYSLHDWYDYAGKLNQRRAANRERMQRARAAHGATHVQRTVHTRVELPNQPNQPNQPAAAAASRARGDESFEDEAYRQVCDSWLDQMGSTLTPVAAEQLVARADRTSVEWVQDAIREAALNGGRNASYVLKVLERWERDGREDKRPKLLAHPAAKPQEVIYAFPDREAPEGRGS